MRSFLARSRSRAGQEPPSVALVIACYAVSPLRIRAPVWAAPMGREASARPRESRDRLEVEHSGEGGPRGQERLDQLLHALNHDGWRSASRSLPARQLPELSVGRPSYWSQTAPLGAASLLADSGVVR